MLTSSRLGRGPARWLKLILLLSGDIERNPGPMRHKSKKLPVPRGHLDLTVGFKPVTSKRMQSCLDLFRDWLLSELMIELQSLFWDYQAAPLALRAYGLHLFKQGSPRYLYVYTITGFQDLCPHMRPFLASAWQVDRKWQQYEPGECRPVISSPIMLAIAGLSLMWGWHRWLGITLIGFLGMLHPAEFVPLLRSDLLLPQDSLLQTPVFYVHLRHPKTARFARRQHCKIDDVVILRFVEKIYGHLPPQEVLFPGSISAYRRRWNAVLSHLGVPCMQKDRGATPATLRGSGATHMYLQCEDLSRIQWRGRWSQLKTVEHYIQEVAAQTLMHSLDSLSRNRVKVFSEAASALMLSFLVDDVKEF